jgi:hypothetical protein
MGRRKIAEGGAKAVEKVGDFLYDLSNSQKTQVATTGGSYQKARGILDQLGVGDDVIDYGAGKGLGSAILRGESYEPFPQGWTPDYTSPPNREYEGVVNMNVLNVLPPEIREQVANEILNSIKKDGYGVVGARSFNDVMTAKNPQILDDGGIMTSRGTYQYGFGGENEGLVDFLQRIANDIPDKEFEITPEKIAATGAKIKRLKSGALPTVGAGLLGSIALTSSEEAEAVPWKSAGDALDRMLKIGMVKPESAANPSAVKSAYTKYQKSWKDSKAFREREQMAFEADEFVKFSETPLGSRIVADLESMVGKPIMPVRGDRSNIGILESVGGMDLNVPVEGGNKFSQQNAGTGAGWASMFGIAKGVQNKINKIAEATGQNPIAIYNAMGEDATNFSTPIAEAMLKEAKNMPIAKADIKKFDAEFRKAYPDWVGLESDNAMDQLMGTGDFPMDGAGKMRTAFTDVMKKASYRDRGFPSYDKLIDATRDPDLLGAELGESGLSMFEAIPQQSVRGSSTHKSYDTAIGGNYIGGLPDSRGIPFEVMFPEIMAGQRSRINAGGKPFSYEQMVDAANKRTDTYQMADQQWLDGVMNYLEKNGKRNALVGTSSVGTGSAFADPVSDLRTAEAQFNMSPQERAIDDLRASEREFVPASNPQWKSVPLEGLATALGEIKGNKNYQNFENVAPFGTGLIDYGYNVATGAEQGLLDYLMAGGEVASLPAPLKKAAKGLIGMLK